VARAAMTCVAETSGGRYFDAASADELEVALNEAREATTAAPEPIEPGEPDPQPQARGYAMHFNAIDADGVRHRAQGVAVLGDDGEPFDISSNGRYAVDEAGTYAVTIGVMMKTGETYMPVTVDVEVEQIGDTTFDITVLRPPSVSARFVVDGEETSGAHITAYQDGEEVFSFRRADDAFAPAGTYEFRSEINSDNHLAVEAVLVAGEHTVVTFELVNTVRVYLRLSDPNGEEFRRHTQLWRDGEEIYRVHSSNGSDIAPGEYELRSTHRAAPLTPVMITIPNEDRAVVTTPIDVGWIVVTYDPDGDYPNSQPDRASLQGVSNTSLSAFARLATPIMVQPGTWRVKGWTAAGDFDDIDVEVGSGETVEVMLIPN